MCPICDAIKIFVSAQNVTLCDLSMFWCNFSHNHYMKCSYRPMPCCYICIYWTNKYADIMYICDLCLLLMTKTFKEVLVFEKLTALDLVIWTW